MSNITNETNDDKRPSDAEIEAEVREHPYQKPAPHYCAADGFRAGAKWARDRTVQERVEVTDAMLDRFKREWRESLHLTPARHVPVELIRDCMEAALNG